MAMTPFLVAMRLLPALFVPHPGWHAGHDLGHACPGVSANRCVRAASWAATIPWRGCGECLPHRMIEALPRGGTILQVDVAVEHPLVARHALAWPPTIRPRDVSAGFEGIPRHYGVYQLFARFGRLEAYVWAFFGRAHPTPAQLAAANAELGAVRLNG